MNKFVAVSGRSDRQLADHAKDRAEVVVGGRLARNSLRRLI